MKNNHTELPPTINPTIIGTPIYALYPTVIPTNTLLKINNSVEGECIEQRVERILNNNEPITDGAPIIYNNRKDGVDPTHNVRTDRFELALQMTDHITKTALAKREAFHNPPKTEPQPAPTAAPPGA